jgi:glycosyltransferase involved in cell wall biosynthesis
MHTEASPGWGGQEIRVLRESVGMAVRGHNLVIASHPESRLLKEAERAGIRTVAFVFKRRRFLSTMLFFKKLIEKHKIDVVNTHSSKDSWLVLPAARAAVNKPLVLRTRHLSTRIHPGLMNSFLYNRLPHFIITAGEEIKRQMVETNRYNSNKITSIPTGVDTDIFTPDVSHNDIRLELGLAPSTPLLGSVSVIRSWKGLDYLVRAMPAIIKAVPEVRLLITGEGPYLVKLKRTIKDSGVEDNIHLLGHREDVVDIFKSIDIVIHPSYANEGVPQALLQAMAMKKPVIASDLPALKEVVIDKETGIITPVKDPEGIARAVIGLINDSARLKEMGEKGRSLVLKSYSFTGMIERLETLYNEYPLYRDP